MLLVSTTGYLSQRADQWDEKLGIRINVESARCLQNGKRKRLTTRLCKTLELIGVSDKVDDQPMEVICKTQNRKTGVLVQNPDLISTAEISPDWLSCTARRHGLVC